MTLGRWPMSHGTSTRGRPRFLHLESAMCPPFHAHAQVLRFALTRVLRFDSRLAAIFPLR